MIKIAVASQNPVKIKAVEIAFSQMFPGVPHVVEGISVPSGVSDQPMSDQETFAGARNRVETLSQSAAAEYWVGIEGGLEEKAGELEAFAWAVVKTDKSIGKGRTATFFLPEKVTTLIRQGKELAHAADIVFNESGSGHKQGTIGILTGNAIDRTLYYVQAVSMAFIPFKNAGLYAKD